MNGKNALRDSDKIVANAHVRKRGSIMNKNLRIDRVGCERALSMEPFGCGIKNNFSLSAPTVRLRAYAMEPAASTHSVPHNHVRI